jgi:hypothetical protein
MPPITINKTGPLSSTGRARRKRERDAARALAGDLRGLSDSGLMEQLARTFLKARKSGARDHAVIVRGLLKEAARRLK